MSIANRVKRFFVEWLAGKDLGEAQARAAREASALRQVVADVGAKQDIALDRLVALEQQVAAVEHHVAAVEQAEASSRNLPDELRRLRADQKLQAQVALVEGLKMQGPARSVIFLHNSYYHFFYLARALRERGWRAVSVSLEDPNGINAQYYHGEDINMHDADPLQHKANIDATFDFAKRCFQLFHFSGAGILGFYPSSYALDEPPEIEQWKRLGKKVAYTINGCKDATSQTEVRRWAMTSTGRSLCDNCVWQHRPDVCNDKDNLAWGAKLHRYANLVFSEMQPSLDYLSSKYPNVVRGPHTMPNDEMFWRPDLEIPAAFLIPREAGEVFIYHAVGNYDYRSTGGRNIKGTPAVVDAIHKLRAEGLKVKLLFFSKVPNTHIRYYQAQADIVVDQLWAGNWGATAREAMMLGKPVVGFVNPFEYDERDRLEVLETTPIVNADVDTVYEVLRSLVLDPARRQSIGCASREFAVRWHGAKACAERYERAYDGIMAGDLRVETP
jgi:glycosyltransferase involved in cell wall biosynthesis